MGIVHTKRTVACVTLSPPCMGHALPLGHRVVNVDGDISDITRRAVAADAACREIHQRQMKKAYSFAELAWLRWHRNTPLSMYDRVRLHQPSWPIIQGGQPQRTAGQGARDGAA